MDFYIEQKHDTTTFDEVISFRGEIRGADLVRLTLNPLDRAILADKSRAPADYLLVLEMLFRRYAEQTPNS